MDDNKVNSCSVNFLDFFFFFKGYLVDLTKRRFYFAGHDCTKHILKYVYEFVPVPHHFLAVQQSAFLFFFPLFCFVFKCENCFHARLYDLFLIPVFISFY